MGVNRVGQVFLAAAFSQKGSAQHWVKLEAPPGNDRQ